MQILNIKTQTERAGTIDEPAIGMPSDAREPVFIDVLSEHQQRQDKAGKTLDAAKIAMGTDKPETPEQVADGEEWHDFLQHVHDGEASSETLKTASKHEDTAPSVGFGDEPVGIVGAPQASDNHWTVADIEQVIGAIESQGITLSEEEVGKLQALVATPKQSETGILEQITQQLEQALPQHAKSTIESFITLPEDTQPGLTLVGTKRELTEALQEGKAPEYQGEKINDAETLRAWLIDNKLLPADNTAEIPEDVVRSITQGDFSLLKGWLAEQGDMPTDNILPIDTGEIKIADLAVDGKGGIQNKEDFQAWLAAQNLPANVRAAAMALFEQGHSIFQAAQSTQSESVQAAFSRFVSGLQETLVQHTNPQQLSVQLEQMKHQLEAVKINANQPAVTENKVLQAFTAAAQDLKSIVQEIQRSDTLPMQPKEAPMARLVESVGVSPSGADTNTQSSTAPMFQMQQQPTQASPTVARPVAAAGQPVESMFEQARQQQQYIDLFSPRAATQLKDQVAVMFNNRNQFAEMRLDPPELGRLNIRLQMNGEQQAAVTFVVHSPQAREAVEQALSRLRDMLQEQGIQLTDANVREENAQHANEGQKQAQRNGQRNANNGDTDQVLEENEHVRQANLNVPEGRIDYYV